MSTKHFNNSNCISINKIIQLKKITLLPNSNSTTTQIPIIRKYNKNKIKNNNKNNKKIKCKMC